MLLTILFYVGVISIIIGYLSLDSWRRHDHEGNQLPGLVILLVGVILTISTLLLGFRLW